MVNDRTGRGWNLVKMEVSTWSWRAMQHIKVPSCAHRQTGLCSGRYWPVFRYTGANRKQCWNACL